MRPRKRGDCDDIPRPCPYVGCMYHLALSVSSRGSIRAVGLSRVLKLGAAVGEELLDSVVDALPHMEHTCTLDVAEDGEQTLEAIGKILGVTKEAVRQTEEKSLSRLRHTYKSRGIDSSRGFVQDRGHVASDGHKAYDLKKFGDDVDRAFKRVVPEGKRALP